MAMAVKRCLHFGGQTEEHQQKEHQQKVLDGIDLSGLNPEERQEVQQLIATEADIFSVVDSYIANITLTQMEIKLQDKTPVQISYHSVPKPLYAELKAHIENLHNKGWIIHSSSSYSSRVVSVRKKDGSLRLCYNYHQLNRKNHPRQTPFI